MRKNKKPFSIEKLKISDIGSEGKALGKWEEKVVFVPLTMPGDVVDVQITRQQRNFLEGKAVRFHRHSKDRQKPFCEHFGVCGGCRWQHLPYPMQLKYKQKQVTDQLERIGRLALPRVSPIMPSPETRFYRNKLEFTFSNNRWLSAEEMEKEPPAAGRNALGFHIPGRFDKVLDIKRCHLQPDPSNEIRLAVKEYALKHGIGFFDLRQQKGMLRNLVVRTSLLGEVMIIVVFYEAPAETREGLLDHLWASFPVITSLHYTINRKANDSLFDLDIVHYRGRETIIEQMDALKFRIGPKSFYQTNPAQAGKMYAVIRKWASLAGREVVYDLYTGTGTIALYLARDARKVIGIEVVPEAIQDAWENARLNMVNNVHFEAGDMKDILNREFFSKHGQPNLIILDPPRTGIHQKVTDALLTAMPERMIYVSCNPATQARDLNLVSHRYRITGVQAVDMFPHTQHVENMVLLERVEKGSGR